MINDILVHLSVDKPNDIARDYAVSIIHQFDAHLSGVAFVPEFPAWATTEGIDFTMLADWSAKQQTEVKKAVDAFDQFTRRHGVHSDSRVIFERLDESGQRFSELARNYDLAVLAQSQETDDVRNEYLIEAALFNSGRPVLVVPFIQMAGMKLDRVMVCWDGSQNAARAVGDAMPFLERAQKVEVITIESKKRRQELCGSKIAEHLARHKINLELKAFVAPDREAADIILNEVTDEGVDLIVMGAYGHSRFREFTLGGVTRSILNSMTTPVLMSH